MAWREKGPAPSLTRSHSRSGGKGVSPDPGVTGSGSSGAKPRGASGWRAIGNFTSLRASSWRGGGGSRGVWVSLCVSPATQLPSQREEAGGGQETECLRGAPCSPLLPGAPEGNGWACNQIGLILFGFTWLLLRAECSAEEWGVKGHPESPEGARRIRSGSRAGW